MAMKTVRHLQNTTVAVLDENRHFKCHRHSTIREYLCAALSNTLSAGLYRSRAGADAARNMKPAHTLLQLHQVSWSHFPKIR